MPRSRGSVQFYLRELQSLRDRHCSQVLEKAREEAAEIIKPAFRDARLRAHAVLTEERTRLQQKIRSAEARLCNAQLQRRHRQQVDLLQLAHEELLRTLHARWLDPVTRNQWVAALLESAVERLAHEDWEIWHPEDWGLKEIDAARDYLASQGVQAPSFLPDGNLRAGLRIRCEGVVMDGSAWGLAGEPQRIKARMLALLITRAEGSFDEQSTHPLD